MWLFKLKVALAAVLVVGIAGAGAGFALQQAATKPADPRQPESPRAAVQEAGKPSEPQAPQIAARTGELTLTGTVLMPDGSPAAGAVVSSLHGEEGIATAVRVDSQGRFRLTGHFGQNCGLHAYSADMRFQTTFHIAEVLARKRSATPVEMKLTPAREHGVTVTAEKVPVEGAQVAAKGVDYKIQGVTDKEGKVKLRVPSEEPLNALAAWHPRLGAAGFRNYDHGITTAASRLALLPPEPHTIRVTDTDGHAVPNLKFGVHFTIEVPKTSWISTSKIAAAQVCTDASGEVIVPWLPRKLLYLNAEIIGSDAGDWKIDKTDCAKSPEGLTTIRVQRKIPVQGQLIMPQGVSAEGLLVAGRGGNGDYATARADRDGSFMLRVVAWTTATRLALRMMNGRAMGGRAWSCPMIRLSRPASPSRCTPQYP